MYMQGGGLWCGTRCVEDTYARSRRVKVQVCRPQQVNVRLFTNECFSLSSKQVNRQFMRGKTINERGRSSTFMNEWAGGSGVEKGIGRRSTNCTIFLARPWSRRGGECKGSGNGPCAARNVRESSHLFAPDLRFVWGRQGQRGSRSGNSMCIFGRRSLVVSTLLYLHVLAPWIAIFYSLQSSHRCCQRRGRKKKKSSLLQAQPPRDPDPTSGRRSAAPKSDVPPSRRLCNHSIPMDQRPARNFGVNAFPCRACHDYSTM